MDTIYILYTFSFLVVLLGFIALLTQKIYIDPETKELTEIELPIIGKLRTNIPALAFVFLGTFMAYIASKKTPEPRQWKIEGTLNGIDNSKWDPTNVDITLFPAKFEKPIVIRRDSTIGTYEITGHIVDGKKFEDIIDYIDISSPDFSTKIYPDSEYQRYLKKPGSSLLETLTRTSRHYKAKHVENW
jgi:hypothetical protein